VVAEQPARRQPLDVEVPGEQLLGGAAQCGPRRLVGRPRVHERHQPLGELAVGVEEGLLLAGEVVRERAPGHRRRVGDRLDRDVVDAVLDGQPQRGLVQRLPGGGLLALPKTNSFHPGPAYVAPITFPHGKPAQRAIIKREGLGPGVPTGMVGILLTIDRLTGRGECCHAKELARHSGLDQSTVTGRDVLTEASDWFDGVLARALREWRDDEIDALTASLGRFVADLDEALRTENAQMETAR
jgi:hypothetical protein